MNKYLIFIDVSLNPKAKIGFGAFLILPNKYLEQKPDEINKMDVIQKIMIRKFENTSSTRLEIETVLWAIAEAKNQLIAEPDFYITLFTDSQCVAGLPDRRGKLELTNFCKSGTDSPIKNAELYQKFYSLQDEFNFEIVKVRGHSRKSSQDTIHRIFSYVDREVRRRFKDWDASIK